MSFWQGTDSFLMMIERSKYVRAFLKILMQTILVCALVGVPIKFKLYISISSSVFYSLQLINTRS